MSFRPFRFTEFIERSVIGPMQILSRWPVLGRFLFWFGWPMWWFYLRFGPVRTKIVVIAGGTHILLVKPWLGSGQWSLPGGGVHADERPIAGAVRELYEETCLRVREDQLSAVVKKSLIGDNGLKQHLMCFKVAVGKQAVIRPQAGEILAAQWFSWRELDNIKIGSTTQRLIDQAWTKHDKLSR